MFSDNDSENMRSVRFADQVAPGESVTLTKTVENAATVEDVTIRIYRGAELALQVEPFVKRNNRRFPLIDFHGKDHVDGDGDFFEFPVSESISVDDKIGVEATNVADDYAFDFSTDFVVDRAGGTNRVVSFVRDLI